MVFSLAAFEVFRVFVDVGVEGHAGGGFRGGPEAVRVYLQALPVQVHTVRSVGGRAVDFDRLREQGEAEILQAEGVLRLVVALVVEADRESMGALLNGDCIISFLCLWTEEVAGGFELHGFTLVYCISEVDQEL